MVLKAFKLRLYPNKTQRNQIHVNFGCACFVWNQMLSFARNRELHFTGRFQKSTFCP